MTVNTQANQGVVDDLARLRRAANVAIVLSWLVGIGGFFAGLALASSSGNYGEHPSIGAGIATAGASIVLAVLLAVIGRWAVAWETMSWRATRAAVGEPLPPPSAMWVRP